MSTSGRSYVQRVPASVAARLAGVRVVSSFFITSMVMVHKNDQLSSGFIVQA